MISEPRCRYITLVIGGNGETDAVVRECVATALIKASRTLLPPYASLATRLGSCFAVRNTLSGGPFLPSAVMSAMHP
ncbi:hypothetical protein SAMN05445850_7670 [Paraburkholderia tuberum]|uniref:Uncharacterized protein n=1 Tax=Paraburkholderia tuberum TaxID=157910 RepID=A0A1H1KH40_9BURK|nr:hypothetical protein SAMN05445850_7670 [Paraburkholderia tuberum]